MKRPKTSRALFSLGSAFTFLGTFGLLVRALLDSFGVTTEALTVGAIAVSAIELLLGAAFYVGSCAASLLSLAEEKLR